jgi:hypothetical protein
MKITYMHATPSRVGEVIKLSDIRDGEIVRSLWNGSYYKVEDGVYWISSVLRSPQWKSSDYNKPNSRIILPNRDGIVVEYAY